MSGLLEGAGVLIAAGAAAGAIVSAPSRRRSLLLIVALVLFPALIVGDQWDSTQISDLRDSPAHFAGLALLAGGAVTGLAFLFDRRPRLLPLAIFAALPFRIPLEAGGDTVYLLVPLYIAIGGGVLATAWRDRGASPPARAAVDRAGAHGASLPLVLAAFVTLYALQTLYSEDFSNGLQSVCFFVVPFSLAFVLVREASWDRTMLLAAVAILAAEALVFVAVGFVEYAVRDLIWNPQVIASNELHDYFRVNSLFWDPNIYGRYLTVVIVAATARLLWTQRPRVALLMAASALVMFAGLVITFSQSSFAAMLAGLATLAVLRWSARWTLAAAAGAALAAVVFVLAAGGSLNIDLSSEKKADNDVGGRVDLVQGGLELFADRPIWGYGSGSFSKAFLERQAGGVAPVSESHTEPVTVAAEQGVIGLLGYFALLAVSLLTLGRGLGGSELRPGAGPGGRAPPAAARAGLLAMYIALIVHTLGYAGYFEDPITWVLLAIGAALAAQRSAPPGPQRVRPGT